MTEDMTAETIGIGADAIPAYLARPQEPASRGGVVVIHHMPGWDWASKEITRRFAALGYDAICPNLHHRGTPGAEPDDAAAATRASGGVPDEQLVHDVGAAAEHLRHLPSNNGTVGVIGYCSGGRQSVLAGCRLQLDAAVDCYGAFVLEPPPASVALTVASLADDLANLSCPLLGLFGAEDRNPAPAEVSELRKRLTDLGKQVDFHTYEDAGHAFFAVDRPGYRQAAATVGWARIAAFFAETLGS